MKKIAILFVALVCLSPVFGHEDTDRSPAWPGVRAIHLLKHPACEACGATGAGVQLEVHHVVPFHIDRTKELDPTNLITLCRKGGHLGCPCHLTFGHLGNFQRDNPNVREDAALMRSRLRAAYERARTLPK